MRVISADLDGGELRREKAKDSWYTRSGGKYDEVNIKEAHDRSVKGKAYIIKSEDWDRVFGKNKSEED